MIARRLKELRLEKGLPQKEIAKLLGVSVSAYGFYEQNKREPDIKTLMKLAIFYDVTVDYLIGKTDERGSPGKAAALPGNADALAELPPEARRSVEEYISFIREKYGVYKTEGKNR